MQIKNIKIFDSTVPADGAWIDISNCVAISVGLTGLETNVWIEVSNDPLINIDNPTSQIAAPSAPVLSQAVSPYPGGFLNQGTYFVKLTYVTKFGETVASAESSLAVADGKVLMIAAPGPDVRGLATGYNVYMSKVTNTETLQTTPAYVPQYVLDSTPGQHFAGSGALPVIQPFLVRFGIQNTGIVPPVANTGGGANVGMNITGDLSTGIPVTGSGEISIFYNAPGATSTSAMVNPSCLCWKWLRVRKSGSTAVETIAWLMAQNG